MKYEASSGVLGFAWRLFRFYLHPGSRRSCLSREGMRPSSGRDVASHARLKRDHVVTVGLHKSSYRGQNYGYKKDAHYHFGLHNILVVVVWPLLPTERLRAERMKFKTFNLVVKADSFHVGDVEGHDIILIMHESSCALFHGSSKSHWNDKPVGT